LIFRFPGKTRVLSALRRSGNSCYPGGGNLPGQFVEAGEWGFGGPGIDLQGTQMAPLLQQAGFWGYGMIETTKLPFWLGIGLAMGLWLGPLYAQEVNRTQLPIPDTQYKFPGKVPLDARDAKFPPIKELRPPKGPPLANRRGGELAAG
jgi:hypothetical protein